MMTPIPSTLTNEPQQSNNNASPRARVQFPSHLITLLTSMNVTAAHRLSKHLEHLTVLLFGAPHRILQQPSANSTVRSLNRRLPHGRRHAIYNPVQDCFRFTISPSGFKSLERRQRTPERCPSSRSIASVHSSAPTHPFRKGDAAAHKPRSARDPRIGPGVHNRSQRFGAHSLGLRPGHKYCLPVEPQPTGNFLPAGSTPATFGKRLMKPPPRGSIRDRNTIPLPVCLSGSLITECASPFPWPRHSEPLHFMAKPRDGRATFAFWEKGYEALPLVTAAGEPYRRTLQE